MMVGQIFYPIVGEVPLTLQEESLLWQQDVPFVQPGIAHVVTVRVNQRSEVGGVESIPLVPSECVRDQSNQASHVRRYETREQQHCVYREQHLEESPVED
jgi:hypothetical protein